MRPEVYAWEFAIPVARPSLWAFVSDTERLNRLAGVFPVHYQYKPLDTGGSEVVAEARAAGMLLRWVERPCEWVEPEFFRFTRDYSKGPFERLVSEVRLYDGERPGTTRLTHTITVTPRHFVGRVLARVAIGVQARAGFARAYALAPQWAAGQDLPAVGSERLPPPTTASTTSAPPSTPPPVQGVAGGHEVALSPAMLELPEVRAALAETKLPARTEELKLKGLVGRHAISIVQVPMT